MRELNRFVWGMCFIVLLTGCGGAKDKNQSRRAQPKEGAALGRIDEGSRCEMDDGHKEVLVDLNQDERPDVRKIYRVDGGNETLKCREADLNFDGKKDIFVFFDEVGKPTRDEVDLDFDGQIDIISIYVNGQIVKQNIDSNSDGLVDRVRFLENDLPLRVEGDNSGDGQVDYWEYYEGGKLVRVGEDRDGDGRADHWSRDAEAAQQSAAVEEETPEGEAETTEEAAEGEEEAGTESGEESTETASEG